MTPSERLDAAYISYLVNNDCGPLLHAMYPVARASVSRYLPAHTDRDSVVQRIVTEMWTKLDCVPHRIRSF